MGRFQTRRVPTSFVLVLVIVLAACGGGAGPVGSATAAPAGSPSAPALAATPTADLLAELSGAGLAADDLAFLAATTFDVVSAKGDYMGGVIAPGINLSLDALVAAAAKLPRIAIEAPATKSVMGVTTETQMLIGVYWGYVAMIEGLVSRMKAEIGGPAKVIATGGLATIFETHSDIFDVIEGDLTINGLAIMYERVK